MKNRDDFKSAVFEKAKQYEIRQKARRKKIVETVSLCSLCLVIGISAYSVAIHMDDFEISDSTTTTADIETSPTLESSASDTPVASEYSATTTTPISTTTTAWTSMTTTAWTSTTIDPFTSYNWGSDDTTFTTTIATTDTETATEQTDASTTTTFPYTTEEPIRLFPLHIYPSGLAADDHIYVDNAYASEKELEHGFLESLDEDRQALWRARYDDAFFEEYSLYIINVSSQRVSYHYTLSEYFTESQYNEFLPDEYEIHVYAIPKNTAFENYILCYEK